MKTEIIPTILVQTFDEVKEKIEAVKDSVEWVQIDVMDGIFVYNETWPHSAVPGIAKRGAAYSKEITKLKKLKTGVKIEVHLMVEKPEKEIKDWLRIADRIIVHFESKITNRELGIRELIEKCHKNKIEFGLAINPETHWAVATPFFGDLDLILLMSIQPGWGGQEMKAWVLEKAEALRERGYDKNIEIDGGVNDENIAKVVKSGINLICVGTYIYRSKNIKEAIKKLCMTL
jgi:ribulose-phosphate 3-epimerase